MNIRLSVSERCDRAYCREAKKLGSAFLVEIDQRFVSAMNLKTIYVVESEHMALDERIQSSALSVQDCKFPHKNSRRIYKVRLEGQNLTFRGVAEPCMDASDSAPDVRWFISKTSSEFFAFGQIQTLRRKLHILHTSFLFKGKGFTKKL